MVRPEIDHVELPNGQFLPFCALHRKVVCGRCCLDFSLALESSDNDDEEEKSESRRQGRDPHQGQNNSAEKGGDMADYPALIDAFKIIKTYSDGDSKSSNDEGTIPPLRILRIPRIASRKASGTVFPSEFYMNNIFNQSPQALFSHDPSSKRFTNRCDPLEILIYTDGACSNNGTFAARAGCGVVFKPATSSTDTGCFGFRLEECGPDGKLYHHTSNRAELRAVIAALRFRFWPVEGFRSLVIATDSTYVVNGATSWARSWMRRGWVLSTGKPVKNRDLWEMLLSEIEKFHENGMNVRLWKIPRKLNTKADDTAKRAAAIFAANQNFTDCLGLRD